MARVGDRAQSGLPALWEHMGEARRPEARPAGLDPGRAAKSGGQAASGFTSSSTMSHLGMISPLDGGEDGVQVAMVPKVSMEDEMRTRLLELEAMDQFKEMGMDEWHKGGVFPWLK